MKQYEKKEYTRTDTRLVKVVCDICGDASTDGEWTKKGDGHYAANETEVRHRHGANYPDGGSGKELEVDICAECFKEVLVPWVMSHGRAKLEYKDWDW